MDRRPLSGPADAGERRPQRALRHSAAGLRASRSHGSRVSLLVAFVANLIVAAAKLAAGLISGSSALLAEATHSVADSINEMLLAAPAGVSAPPGRRPPVGYVGRRFLRGVPGRNRNLRDRRLRVSRARDQRSGARELGQRSRQPRGSGLNEASWSRIPPKPPNGCDQGAAERREVQPVAGVVIDVVQVDQRGLGEVVVCELEVPDLGGDHRLNGRSRATNRGR